MASGAGLRRIPQEIAECPHCGERHVFSVLVRVRGAGAEAVPLFGGPSGGATLAFTCPNTHKLISASVPNPPDGDIIGPDDPNQAAADSEPVAVPEPAPPTAAEQEYADWIKASRTTAVDFCKTMLTTATGGVPVYFAVLKYLGAEAVGGSWFSRIGALPPLLFLAAAIVFALALRPRFASVKPADFADFRTARLRQLNRDILAGLALFAAGVLLAIVLSVDALWR